MRQCDIKIGDKYNKWTVLENLGKGKDYHWNIKCQCECGTIKVIDAQNLIRGKSKSCGCLTKEVGRQRMITHGMTNTRPYYIWSSMRERCFNPNSQAYSNYGGRGITVCQEWKDDFMSFYNWAVNNGYTDELSIDRIDVNGNYCPENCRWITMHEQQNNKRTSVMITYNGKTQNLKMWCDELNLNYDAIRCRYQKHKDMPPEELFKEPKKVIKEITYNGETHTWKEWSKITNIKTKTLHDRYYKGYSLDDVFYKGNIQRRDKLYGKGEK